MSIRLAGDEGRPASSPWPRIRPEEVLRAGRLLADRVRAALTGREPSQMRARLQHNC